MTMRAIADDLGISIPTLYRRLKAAGVNVAELRDDKTGKVTPAGAAVIADLFRDATDNTAVQEIINGDSQSVARDTLTQDADAMSAAVLAAKLEGANALIEQLTNERDALRAQLDALTAALAAEQADRQQERLLLTGGDDLTQNHRRGLFSWLRRR